MQAETSTNKKALALFTAAALAGMLTGCAGGGEKATESTGTTTETKPMEGNAPAEAAGETKSDAGMPAGNAATASEKHDCKGLNSCKGKGGCNSGDQGCTGKNTCKGKGGCKVG